MADPGFFQGDPTTNAGANLLFGIMFTKNCMKIKIIDRGGGGAHNMRGIQDFPKGGANSKGGKQSTIWPIFSWKLRGNKRNWTQRGGSTRPLHPRMQKVFK